MQRRWDVGAWRWGPEVVKQIHQRLVKLAQANGLAAGRRMRVDTTVVETNIHYPTDFELVGGRRAGSDPHHEKDRQDRGRETGAKLRDRGRSVKLRVLDIARAARSRAKQSRERLNRSYGKLLNATSRSGGTGESGSPKRSLGERSARGMC